MQWASVCYSFHSTVDTHCYDTGLMPGVSQHTELRMTTPVRGGQARDGWEGYIIETSPYLFNTRPWQRKQAKEHDLWRAAGETECIQYLVLVAQPRGRARAYCAQGPGLIPHQQTDRQMCAVFSAGKPTYGDLIPEVIPVLP